MVSLVAAFRYLLPPSVFRHPPWGIGHLTFVSVGPASQTISIYRIAQPEIQPHFANPVKLLINGETRAFDSITQPFTLASLVEHLGMKSDRVAIELNRQIVHRDKWSDTKLAEGDQLEIVHFVGGGSTPDS